MTPASGSVRSLLRLEGASVFGIAVVLYGMQDHSWWAFAARFFLPDLSFAGYWAGTRAGAALYNAMHSYVLPICVLALCLMLDASTLIPIVWIAHIGFDRALGYGLKYTTAFTDTHLGTIGRGRIVQPDVAGPAAEVSS